MLEPGWVQHNEDSFDLFHLHFGFDAQSVENLTDVVQALRDHGKPLVYTPCATRITPSGAPTMRTSTAWSPPPIT